MTQYGFWRQAGALAILALALGSAVPSTSAQEQTSYQYDELGRLVASCDVSASKLKTLSYDDAGNRTSFEQSTNSVCGPTFIQISNAMAQPEGQTLVFTVNRTGNLSQPQSIDYVSAAGTAETSDFTATSGTLTFAVNEASKGILGSKLKSSLVGSAER